MWKLTQAKQREVRKASGLCAKLLKRKNLLLKSRPPTDNQQTAQAKMLARKARSAAQMRLRRRRLREAVVAGDEVAVRNLQKKRDYDKEYIRKRRKKKRDSDSNSD